MNGKFDALEAQDFEDDEAFEDFEDYEDFEDDESFEDSDYEAMEEFEDYESSEGFDDFEALEELDDQEFLERGRGRRRRRRPMMRRRRRPGRGGSGGMRRGQGRSRQRARYPSPSGDPSAGAGMEPPPSGGVAPAGDFGASGASDGAPTGAEPPMGSDSGAAASGSAPPSNEEYEYYYGASPDDEYGYEGEWESDPGAASLIQMQQVDQLDEEYEIESAPPSPPPPGTILLANFHAGRATLLPQHHRIIHQIAFNAITRMPRLAPRHCLVIIVQGHEDPSDRAQHRRLGAARAMAVARAISNRLYALIGRVPVPNRRRVRIRFGAAGSSRPIRPGHTPAGRAMNRRVEVRLRNIAC